jgi:beta-ketoacyl-acyl-carrier-protein synthase II
MTERVVVTGTGTINPIGHSVEETWQNALNGVSGVAPISLFDPGDQYAGIACEVKDFNPDEVMPAREVRRRDRYQQFSTVAVREAINQSGLDVERVDPTRVSVVLSTATGGIESLYGTFEPINSGNPRRISPFLIPMFMPNGAAGLASIDYGFQGPSFCVASACASGADGIGVALLMLKAGVVDVALAGASEATITKVGIAAFDRVGALSRRVEDYAMTPQPFDLNRDGLVMGEGAAVLVLERESFAKRRGAEILAELAGYGASADAYHITAPAEGGEGAALAIRRALESASIHLDQVDYINAHGTATQLNDQAETQAIKSVFGQLAYNIPVSSTKSMTGHMMGATGALEVIFCVEAIRDKVLPPTIHYQTPDPQCDLDYVPNQARGAPVSVAVSNSLGFGGHNAVLVIREYN